ncbi:MAG: hypothetical protein SF339_20795 [Blastocatellia bacterium]|nr:hypothetical protein [Blastocatellia bacterium]
MQSENHSEEETDGLRAEVYGTREEAAMVAARAVGDRLRRLIEERGRAIGLFDSAPSLAPFLEQLAREPVAWTRVIALQTGEFAGPDEEAPESRRFALIDRLVRRVPMAEFHGMRGEAANLAAVLANYASLMASRPPDFAVLGLGRSGELGFLGSRDCDLDNPAPVRLIDLDEGFRREQVEAGLFASLRATPSRALAVTVPAILRCAHLFLLVDGAAHRPAVRDLLYGEISPVRPASLLRTHRDVRLFLDAAAAEGGGVTSPVGSGSGSAS